MSALPKLFPFPKWQNEREFLFLLSLNSEVHIHYDQCAFEQLGKAWWGKPGLC